MSADEQVFSSFRPAKLEDFSDAQPDMETLKAFMNERLTAAVEDILSLFGKTVARYRQQLDCQQRQLDRLRSGEREWSRAAESLGQMNGQLL